jgi:hypothetical protein
MLLVESEQEEDGRWIAEVVALPGVLAYGVTKAEANAKAKRRNVSLPRCCVWVGRSNDNPARIACCSGQARRTSFLHFTIAMKSAHAC